MSAFGTATGVAAAVAGKAQASRIARRASRIVRLVKRTPRRLCERLLRVQAQLRDGRLSDWVRPPREPVLDQVVVVAAARMARLARHVLPARELRVPDVREEPER